MTTQISNQAPFLRVQRNFPPEQDELLVELDKSYLDIASAVNQRTISTFATDLTYLTGEQWFLQGNPRTLSSFRQVYPITGTGSYIHDIDFNRIQGFSRIWGTFTDGTVFYPLPYVDETSATNQISINLTSTNIVITAGAGSPPTISNGLVVLEWIG